MYTYSNIPITRNDYSFVICILLANDSYAEYKKLYACALCSFWDIFFDCLNVLHSNVPYIEIYIFTHIKLIYKCLFIKLKKKEIIQSLKKFVKISRKCFILIYFIIRKKYIIYNNH